MDRSNGQETALHLAELRQQVRQLQDQVHNLEIALTNARTIGAAIGIVMHERKVTQGAAFELIVAASQTRNTKLRFVAEDLVLIGTLAP